MNLGYIINNAQFRPFSYAELIQPLQQQTDYQNQLEDAISQLGAQADAVGSMANQTTDPETYARYKAYSDALAQQASDLAQRGLTPGSRSILNNLRQTYSTDIIPIQNAVTRRREFEDEQRKMSLQDPTRIWQRRAGSISLDELVNNPNMDYGQSYSGAMIAQQAYQAAGNLAKEAQNSEAGRQKLRELLPYQYEYIRQRGFTSDAVLKAIQGSPEASKILTGLVDQVVASTGIQNWNDPVALQRAYDYARQGLWAAVGTQDSQIITDQWGLEQAKAALDHKYRQQEMQAAQNNMAYANIPSYTRDITTPGNNKVNANKVAEMYGVNPQTGKYSKFISLREYYTPGIAPGVSGHYEGNGKKYRLWTNNGRMLTKQEFINQGKSDDEKQLLANHYNYLIKYGNSIGFNISNLQSRNNGYKINYFMNKLRNTGSMSATVNDLPLNDSDIQRVTRRVQNNAGNSIREFKGFDAKGNPILGKLADNKKLFSKEKEGKYNNVTGYMSPSYPSANGTGFIMQDNDGHLYWVPGNKISNSTPVNQRAVRHSLDMLERERRATNMSDEQYRMIKSQIIAAGVRNDVTQLGGTYTPPSTNMVNSSANEEP